MAAAFGASNDQAKKAFDAIDTDKSGEISLGEIATFFGQMDKDGKDDCLPTQYQYIVIN